MTGIQGAVVASVLAALMMPSSVNAIVMRHDRGEKASIDLAARFPATATFRLSINPTDVAGTGTLIDPSWVLTAAHVADHIAAGAFVELGDARYQIEAIMKHPDWRGFGSWEDMRADIALIRLRTAVKGVTPVPIYTGTDEANMTVTFVGMGSYGTGLTGPTTHSSRMLAATNRVEKADGPYLRFRFDAPQDPDVTPLEGISGAGDSGGPAYAERGGLVYVIGVSSAQDARPAGKKVGHYGVLEYYPRVSFYAGWIRETLGAH